MVLPKNAFTHLPIMELCYKWNLVFANPLTTTLEKILINIFLMVYFDIDNKPIFEVLKNSF